MLNNLKLAFRSLLSEKLFKIPNICLTISGFASRNKYSWIVQWFLIVCNAYTGLSELLSIMTHQNNMAEAAGAFGTFVTAILVEAKALTFVLKREKIGGLNEKIKKLNDEGLSNSYDHQSKYDFMCFQQSIRMSTTSI
jgi:hypothetical protein